MENICYNRRRVSFGKLWNLSRFYDNRDDTFFCFAHKGGLMAAESRFEVKLIRKILREYPGAIILKNDPNYMQGVPDRLVLFENKWAAFEVKGSIISAHRVNQDYYIDLLNKMSFASFVYPENEEVFLHGLQQTFRPSRSTRLPKR